ncbi:MAG: hypothetical protein K9G24_01755 [Candidatus Nanopelagicales bacterium]|nr:hypothetical protein [Candidatus Nanopelagicales bacterium]MCF8536801.1 hypothetical protein [Candidatus Nanopelagicales bacterium]MCF8541786.1 hypothetical protein [Candidatus Nanopelagicales bacterium]MCF8556173.1 hypothetical protein [Candidatus Nanopelagicales bacterium]
MHAHEDGTPALDHVIVVPRNGYINRLQAWASSAILAAELHVPLSVAWEPEPVAPAALTDLFIPDRPGVSLISAAALRSCVGMDHDLLDRYLWVDESRRLVVLAGHDRGEQAFMPSLAAALGHPCEPTTLLIIAGGKFHLQGTTGFEEQRRLFYRRLPWSTAVSSRTQAALAGRDDFIGLHIRETDRAVTAPTRREVRDAIVTLADRTGVTSVFIAADSVSARLRWLEEVATVGLEGWSASEPELDRSSARAGVDAMVDWRLLGLSMGVVYSRESSFGEEAAIAVDAGRTSIPLSAGQARQRSRMAVALGRSAVGYPHRRWVQGRKPS